MTKTVSIFSFLLLIANFSFGCDCDPTPTFKEVSQKAKTVVLVKVLNYDVTKERRFHDYSSKPSKFVEDTVPISMKVEVKQIFKGIESRDTITVWGDYGTLCRPYLTQFEIGEEYVLALFEGKRFLAENYGESSNDYYITNCGDGWMSYNTQDKIGSGLRNGEKKEYSLEEIENLFN